MKSKPANSSALKLPREAAIRLEALAEVSRKIGGKVVAIGKIIVLKLLEFVRQNSGLAIGVALGAALSVLIAGIPFLGPLLAPVALAFGVTVGAIAGHRVDKGATGPVGIIGIAQEIIEIAQAFFALPIAIFHALSDELGGEALSAV
ncbi:MAG: hypothetical protein LBU43_05430 [Candidatus Accumulibacter sp.]|jgi:hypothetical protein|nr:hypothetical protein [Accumulibacter sp.]